MKGGGWERIRTSPSRMMGTGFELGMYRNGNESQRFRLDGVRRIGVRLNPNRPRGNLSNETRNDYSKRFVKTIDDSKSGRGDLNSRPLAPRASSDHPEAFDSKQLTTPPKFGCSTGCTNESKNDASAGLDALAVVVLGLKPEERAWLAAILLDTSTLKIHNNKP